jgi:hypothetical protein
MIAMTLGVIEVMSAAVLTIQPNIFGGHATSLTEREARVRASIAAVLKSRPDALTEFHGELGWRPRPGLNNGVDVINRQGLRSPREYSATPAPGVLRIAVFGDSFVYGSEVLTHEALSSVIEGSSPRTELLNYGVPQYGQDQIYLRFLAEGRDLKPKVIVFGVAPPTLERLLSQSGVFRFPSSPSTFITKPRFVLDGDRPVLTPNQLRRIEDLRRYLENPSLVRELGAFDYWYEPFVYESGLFNYSRTVRLLFAGWTEARRRFIDADRPLKGPRGAAIYNESSSGFRILTRIIERFVATASEWGVRPVVLFLPDGYSVERMRSGRPGIMDPLRDFCRAAGFEHIDAKDAFLAQPAAVPTSAWFIDNFHYSVEGNRIVADWLRREIERRGW